VDRADSVDAVEAAEDVMDSVAIVISPSTVVPATTLSSVVQAAQRVAPSGRARRNGLFPSWVPGPKPRRRTELGLLIFASLITVALYVIAELGAKSRIPPHIGPFLGVVLGLALVAHVANRWLVPNANPIILPLAALLNGIGYVVIARWNPPYAKAQAGWVAIGIGLYVLTLVVVRRTRDLDRYRYLLLLLTAILLVSPLIPHVGLEEYGARLWVRVAGVQFQPVEIAKVLLCIFFASYFAEKKELLSIPTRRFGNRLVVDPAPLVPIMIAWAFATMVIGVENDIGFAMLIFTLFIALLWITTGRFAYLVLGLVLFAVGAVVAAHLFSQVHVRVSIWLDPWKTLYGSGQQLGQGWFALAGGGIGGIGLGLDKITGQIPQLTSDMVFAAVGNQLGLVGASAVVIAFVLMVGSGLQIAQRAHSDFARLVAVGLTTILGFQAFFIMAGVLRLLPLTGITLPFVAYGGSSLVTNYILIALLLRISDESAPVPGQKVSVAQPGDRAFVVAKN
jgi:cell division protein FtsW (lipid II flippase)